MNISASLTIFVYVRSYKKLLWVEERSIFQVRGKKNRKRGRKVID